MTGNFEVEESAVEMKKNDNTVRREEEYEEEQMQRKDSNVSEE